MECVPSQVEKRQIQTSVELLVANSFVRYKGLLADETAVCMRDPAPMTEGTDTRAEVGLLLEQWKTLRQRGHEGPATQWYVFDGKGIGKLERLLRGFHSRGLLKAESHERPSVHDIVYAALPCSVW